MSAIHTVNVSEFKAKCLEILDRLDKRAFDQVVITRHGRTIAILSPSATDEEKMQSLHGFMRGTVTIPPGFDLTEPASDTPFAASPGLLHE